MRPFGKIAGKTLVESLKSEMKSKEQNESDRKVQESLDHFIRQAIGKESFLSYSRPGENPVQWVQWLESLDQQSVNKHSKGSKVEAGLYAKEGGQKENVAINCSLADLNVVKESTHNNTKGAGTFGRGLQSPTQRMHSLKIPEAVVAFAQAAAKANGEPEKYLPGWPLLSPKVQMLKCEKCSQEFCSPLNHRRHTRMHRRPLNVEKEDLRKERANLAAFWNKLSTEEAKQIVSFKNIMLKDVPGASIVRSLSSFIQQPGLVSLPQFYLKAGATLLDVVQIKSSKFPLPAEDLFSILDDASERTFLCAGTSVSMQRLVFEGEAGKMGLEGTNLVASLGFLVEQRLVKAWIVDKDAEALRCQKELVEEEEAVQKKQAELLERKRLKKLRQKESREKERKADDRASAVVVGSVDGEGNSPVLGEGDDSLTAVESSSPSTSSSAQDLCNQEQRDEVGNLDVQSSEGVDCKILRLLGEEFLENSPSLMDESADQIPVVEGHSHLNKDSTVFGETDVAHNSNNLRINDSDLRSRAAQVSAAEVSLISSCHFTNKGDQDKSTVEYSGRAGILSDRKLVQCWRERKRYVGIDSASYQKHPYDSERRLSDTNTQRSLKLMRKSCNGFSSGQDSLGVALIPKTLSGDRSEKYTDIPLGRRMPAVGNGYKMWTRKTQQTSSSDSCKALKSKRFDVSTDGTCTSKVGELTQLLPDASSTKPTCEGGPVVEMKGSDVTIVETGSSKGDHNVTIPVILANDENDHGYMPDQKFPDGEFLIGSMCVSLNNFSDAVRWPRPSECTIITDRKHRHLSAESQHKPRMMSTPDHQIWSEVGFRADGEIHETVNNCFSEVSKEHSTVLNGFVILSPIPNKEDHTDFGKPLDNFSGGGDSPRDSCGHLVGHEKFAKQGFQQNGVNGSGVKVWQLVEELHDSERSGIDALSSVDGSKDTHNSVSVLDFEAQAAVGSIAEPSLKQDSHISGNMPYTSVIPEGGICTSEIQHRKEDGDNDSSKCLKLADVGSLSNGSESQYSNGLTRIQGSSEYIWKDKTETVDQLELEFSLACDCATNFLYQRWEDAIVDPGALVVSNADSGVVTDTNGASDQVYDRDLGSPDR